MQDRTVPIIMAGCIAHVRNGRISTSGLKSDVNIVFLDPISCGTQKFRRFAYIEADIGLRYICMNFQDLLAENGVLESKIGERVVRYWPPPIELVFIFGSSYVCASFGKNRSRNATMRVLTDGHTDTLTDWQTQSDFIICPTPMLYAVAMGQITAETSRLVTQVLEKNNRVL